MIFLWFLLGWWFIGFVLTVLGSVLFEEELTVGAVIYSVLIGLLGPVIALPFFMTLAEKYDKIVLWKKKDNG